MKKLIFIFIPLLLPLVSSAAIGIQKQNNGVILTTSRNVYLVGNMVNVSQEKQGDVYALAGSISITGNVNQDLFAAGGNLNVTSRIAGDLRAAGGTINVSGQVNGDFLVAGGQIEIAPSSVVDGDFLVAGGRVNIDGLMNGSGKIAAGEVYISGTLNSDVTVKANRLVIENTAIVNGNISYQGKEEATISEGAQINGKISFTKIEAKTVKPVGFGAILSVVWFIKFLILLVAALILFFLMRRNISRISGQVVDNFWKDLLRGFVLLVVIPVVIVLLFFTIIGSLLGIFGIALYGLLFIIAMVFTGIVVAEFLNRLIFRGKRARPLNWPMVILGVLIMQLLIFIPVVGWVAKFIIFLVSLGAVSNLLYRQVKTLAE